VEIYLDAKKEEPPINATAFLFCVPIFCTGSIVDAISILFADIVYLSIQI
jgi:hypothetical protein